MRYLLSIWRQRLLRTGRGFVPYISYQTARKGGIITNFIYYFSAWSLLGLAFYAMISHVEDEDGKTIGFMPPKEKKMEESTKTSINVDFNNLCVTREKVTNTFDDAGNVVERSFEPLKVIFGKKYDSDGNPRKLPEPLKEELEQLDKKRQLLSLAK